MTVATWSKRTSTRAISRVVKRYSFSSTFEKLLLNLLCLTSTSAFLTGAIHVSKMMNQLRIKHGRVNYAIPGAIHSAF